MYEQRRRRHLAASAVMLVRQSADHAAPYIPAWLAMRLW
jgi:hypothetical protein